MEILYQEMHKIERIRALPYKRELSKTIFGKILSALAALTINDDDKTRLLFPPHAEPILKTSKALSLRIFRANSKASGGEK